jgi:hypothetical protein
MPRLQPSQFWGTSNPLQYRFVSILRTDPFTDPFIEPFIIFKTENLAVLSR